MHTPVRIARELTRLAAGTDRLLATVADWDAEQLALPSVLPGWSRAHVLTHLARNADAMRNVLLGARTAVAVPMYPSRALRDADIAVGATRPASVLLEDLRASAERFALDAANLGPQTFARVVSFGQLTAPAAAMIPHRLREVEAHHVDLVAGYTFSDSPDDVLIGFLDLLPDRFSTSPLAPCTVIATDLSREWQISAPDAAGGAGAGNAAGPRVSGSAAALLMWALGRSDGPVGLTSDRGDVPASPGWG